MSDLYERLLAKVNDITRDEIERRYSVTSIAAVTKGWHRATCWIGSCDWHRADHAPQVEEAARDHVRSEHAAELAASLGLLAVLELHKPRDATTFVGRPRPPQCAECADQCHSGSGLSCDDPDAAYPCETVRAVARALDVPIEGDQL